MQVEGVPTPNLHRLRSCFVMMRKSGSSNQRAWKARVPSCKVACERSIALALRDTRRFT